MIERALARFWNAAESPDRGGPVLEPVASRIRRCERFVRAYYVVGLGVLALGVRAFQPHTLGPHPDPLWPVAWVGIVPWQVASWGLYVLAFGSYLAAALAPARRWTRVCAAVGAYFLFALLLTYPGVQHKWYLFLSTGLILALAPNPKTPCADPAERDRAFLRTVFSAFVFVMFTYSFAGFMKVEGIVEALIQGDSRVLRLEHVPISMYREIHSHMRPTLGAGWVLDHPVLASLGTAGVVYLEFFSLMVLFRPRLHWIWCAGLVGFHVSSFLTLGILFRPALAMLALWIAFPPFARKPWPVSEVVRDLPLIGLAYEALARRLPALAPSAPRSS